MKVIRPFGPSIAKVSIPEDLIKKLNDYLDQITLNNEKIKLQDHGNKLAGNGLIPRDFNLINFSLLICSCSDSIF